MLWWISLFFIDNHSTELVFKVDMEVIHENTMIFYDGKEGLDGDDL